MKTLKQIREEYNNHYTSQVEKLPESIMLEDKSTNPVPSSRDMPTMLIFRRISYRIYPNKQVVALYYSKMLHKYLSIPFGPGGNLNLSESKIYDSYEDLEEGIGSAIDTTLDYTVPYYGAAKKLAKGDFKGAAGEAAIDTASLGAAAATGGLGAGAAFAGRTALRAGTKAVAKGVTKRGIGKVGERLATKVGGKKGLKAYRYLKKKAGDMASGMSSSDSEQKQKQQSDAITHAPTGNIRNVKGPASRSSWSAPNTQDAIYQSKLKAATEKDIQNVKENRISDLRNMINEGYETMDMSINGRQVTLNTSMAKRILEVYDSVNTKNKKIVESMLNEDLESFKKLLNFSIKA